LPIKDLFNIFSRVQYLCFDRRRKEKGKGRERERGRGK
jgi:hypothetical protein